MTFLTTRSLSKHFGGVIAADELDIQVDQGEIVSVIGPNGSGKTTLFNLITGIYKPSKGSIVFRGEDITRRKTYEIINRGIARTFQATRLFSQITVLENVMTGFHRRTGTGVLGALIKTGRSRREERETPQRALEVLEFMRLGHTKDRPAASISGAEQRRLMIAIALATNPHILLLDEPTAGVSAEEAKELLELISEIRKRGIAILLIEHNMKVAMGISERMIVLNFGKKIAEGAPQEIAQNEVVIEAYLGRD
jgi:branched-chain amino acid transport system ATP-binding protein